MKQRAVMLATAFTSSRACTQTPGPIRGRIAIVPPIVERSSDPSHSSCPRPVLRDGHYVGTWSRPTAPRPPTRGRRCIFDRYVRARESTPVATGGVQCVRRLSFNGRGALTDGGNSWHVLRELRAHSQRLHPGEHRLLPGRLGVKAKGSSSFATHGTIGAATSMPPPPRRPRGV